MVHGVDIHSHVDRSNRLDILLEQLTQKCRFSLFALVIIRMIVFLQQKVYSAHSFLYHISATVTCML